MAGLFGHIQSVINRLLPFATPGTPLLQDLAHLGIICASLYFAPQIQATLHRYAAGRSLLETGGLANGDSDHAASQIHEPPVADDHGEPRHVPMAPPAPHVDEEEDDSDYEDDNQHGNEADPLDHVPQDPAQPVVGPVNPPSSHQQRPVGAKKAKSLARRDQRRAYHEFMRSQGEAQRAADAEGESERQELLSRERERRAAAEADIVAREAKAREDKKQKEKRQRETEARRRTAAVESLKRRMTQSRCFALADVVDEIRVSTWSNSLADVDIAWVESLAKASGLLGRKSNDELVMVTGHGWLAQVTAADMHECYKLAQSQNDMVDEHGRTSYEDIGRLLVDVIRKPTIV